ncbi:siderophore-interacting protein [Pseudonocardia sp. NPDC049635]|uniref:siderophore-interacting protein n=1 Tax=Pseudonocardia sp. NPDC049635 TaxID=3155506 RepID=UPI0033C23E24
MSRSTDAAPARFTARVRERTQVSPHMVRLYFDGPGLAGFCSTGVPDERLHLYLPEAQADPEEVIDRFRASTARSPERELPLARRSYTVQDWDPDTGVLAIDFAEHRGGAVTEWLRRARPGAPVGLSAASGWYAPPEGTTWQLLVSDMTGLPALGRILDGLGDGARVHVVTEVPTDDDDPGLPGASGVTHRRLVGSGNGRAPSRLTAAATSWEPPDGPGYVWCAAEAATCQEIKAALREHPGQVGASEIRAYWRAGRER